MIADHHICFTSVEVPYRQPVILLVEGNEGFYHVVDTLRLCVSEERMGCTIGIPQGESAVVHPAVCLVHFLIRAVVSAVHIIVDSRGNHRMIESGVEVYFVVFVIAFHFDFTKLAVPIRFCFSQVFVEVVFGDFRLQVFGCTVHACAGNGSIDENLLTFFGIEVEAGDDGCTDTFVVFDNSRSVQFHFLERSGETGAEIDVLVACPTIGEAVALNGNRVYLFDIRIISEVPVHGLFQI